MLSCRVSKIGSSHRGRGCMVYVRQSTLAQTRANTESLDASTSWPGGRSRWAGTAQQVRVIDADLGRSGAEATGREGFQELVAEVALGQVGLMFGVEVCGWPGRTPTGISCWTCAR